jgi:hypothetical protein
MTTPTPTHLRIVIPVHHEPPIIEVACVGADYSPQTLEQSSPFREAVACKRCIKIMLSKRGRLTDDD